MKSNSNNIINNSTTIIEGSIDNNKYRIVADNKIIPKAIPVTV
jgi:hypothetical protein